MKTNPKLWIWLVNAGLILIAVALIPPLDRASMTTMRWVYTAGALATLVGRMNMQPVAESLRARRLQRIGIWSSIFFCFGAVLLFWPTASAQDWLAFTMAGAAIVIYITIMTPRVLRGKQ